MHWNTVIIANAMLSNDVIPKQPQRFESAHGLHGTQLSLHTVIWTYPLIQTCRAFDVAVVYTHGRGFVGAELTSFEISLLGEQQ